MIKKSMADAYRAPQENRPPPSKMEDKMAILMLSMVVDMTLGSPEVLPFHTPWIANHYRAGFQSLLKSFVADIEEKLDSSTQGNRCLHDILARIDAWSAANTLDTTLALPADSSGWNRSDQLSSTDKMQSELAARESNPLVKAKTRTQEEEDTLERERDEWERMHPPGTPAQAFDEKLQRYLTSNLFLVGHRLVFNSTLSPLNLIVHLLHTPAPSTRNSQDRIVSDVLAYCVAPPKTLRDRLAIATAPSLWKEHESRLEPIRNRQSILTSSALY